MGSSVTTYFVWIGCTLETLQETRSLSFEHAYLNETVFARVFGDLQFSSV